MDFVYKFPVKRIYVTCYNIGRMYYSFFFREKIIFYHKKNVVVIIFLFMYVLRKLSSCNCKLRKKRVFLIDPKAIIIP